MNDAASWLSERLTDAPEQLRVRMMAALAQTNAAEAPLERMLRAASGCLQRAVQGAPDEDIALELLAADALLTHACEAAGEADAATFAAFTEAIDAGFFDRLLPGRSE